MKFSFHYFGQKTTRSFLIYYFRAVIIPENIRCRHTKMLRVMENFAIPIAERGMLNLLSPHHGFYLQMLPHNYY